MPALLASDAAARVILLEDLRDAEDLFGLYAEGGAPLEVEEIESLADFAHALHGATRGSDLDEFSNREMRALNHAHIFEVPFDPANGLDLEALEPGLDAAAAALRDDTSYRRVVRETGELRPHESGAS